MGFELARKRRRKLTSVDKSNVLTKSLQLCGGEVVVRRGAKIIRDVALDHLLVDNCAMQLVLNPKRFDIVLMENMFGDILSDEGSVLAGSIGMLPSASIGAKKASGVWTGLSARASAWFGARISPGRGRPIRSAQLARRLPCWNTASDWLKKPRR